MSATVIVRFFDERTLDTFITESKIKFPNVEWKKGFNKKLTADVPDRAIACSIREWSQSQQGVSSAVF